MRAGRLRYKVTVQQRATIGITVEDPRHRDEFGAETELWQDVATFRAGIEFLTGKEFYTAQQTNSEITSKIIARYRPGILPEMRVVSGDETFDILAVVPDARRRSMQILCKQVNR